MKFLTLLSIFVCSIVILSVVDATNTTWGTVGPYDRLLARDFVIKPSNWFTKQKAESVYPPKGQMSYFTISAIVAIDFGGRKEFGYASLASGGPGQGRAEVHLKSQARKGLNFTIEYYGH